MIGLTMLLLTALFFGAWLYRKAVFSYVFQHARVSIENLAKHLPPEVQYARGALNFASKLASVLSFGKLRRIEKELDDDTPPPPPGGGGGGPWDDGGGGLGLPRGRARERPALRGHRLPPDSDRVVDLEETSPGFWEKPGEGRDGAATGPVVRAPWESGSGRSDQQQEMEAVGGGQGLPPLPEGSVLLKEGDGYREFVAPGGILCRDEKTPEGHWVRSIAAPMPPAPPPAGTDEAEATAGAPPGQAGTPAFGRSAPGATAVGTHAGKNAPARDDPKPPAAGLEGAGARPPDAALHPRTLEMTKGPSGTWEYAGERRDPPAGGVPTADGGGASSPALAAQSGAAGRSVPFSTHSTSLGEFAQGVQLHGGPPGSFAGGAAGVGEFRSQGLPVQRGEGTESGLPMVGLKDGEHSFPRTATTPAPGVTLASPPPNGRPTPAEPPAPPPNPPGAGTALLRTATHPPGRNEEIGRLPVERAPTARETSAGGSSSTGSTWVSGGTGKASAGRRVHGVALYGGSRTKAGERLLDVALAVDSHSGGSDPWGDSNSTPDGGGEI